MQNAMKCQEEKQTLSFKVKLGDELRRFSMPADVEWEQLVEKIYVLFGVQRDSAFVLKYEDDEKEMITVDSSSELHEAIRVCYQQNMPCLRLEVILSTPTAIVASSPIILPTQPSENARSFSFSGGNNHHRFNHYQHQRPHSNHWNRGNPKCRRFQNREELTEKLKEVEARGFKCKGKIIALLKRYDGDVDKVCEMMVEHQARKGNPAEMQEKLAVLRERGYPQNGINVRLLRRFEGDLDKTVDILEKQQMLVEAGCTHTWMNVRLLLKHEGDVEKVKIIWNEKQEKLLRKQAKRRSKAFEKADKKEKKHMEKADKNEKKHKNKEWKRRRWD
jgi:hypothetical protein